MNLKSDFPWFAAHEGVTYLDSAATTHKPVPVINAMRDFYTQGTAAVYRSMYDEAEAATAAYEHARAVTAQFINAQEASEIIFTKNATEGINLVARGWAEHMLRPGDRIVITELEHHANILPWQALAERIGIELVKIPITDDAKLDVSNLASIITAKTKLVACTASSNVVGPVDITVLKKIIDAAHNVSAAVLIDAAQLVAHRAVDVQESGADFLVFSAHKMYGPLGVGVLYARKERHSEMKPVSYGGGMVGKHVPLMLEAGTQDAAGVQGLAAAISYLNSLDRSATQAHEQGLTKRLLEGLQSMEAVSIVGKPTHESHVVSFNVRGMHPHDVAQSLAQQRIAVRAGNHCCAPLYERLGLNGSVRVSLALYNTVDDIERLLQALS